MKFRFRLQHMWNLMLALAIAMLGIQSFYLWVTLSLDIQTSYLQVSYLSQEVDATSRALAVVEGRLVSTNKEIDLLSDQIEITLDLMVNANRWGWWDREVFNTLAELQRLKAERNTLWHLN